MFIRVPDRSILSQLDFLLEKIVKILLFEKRERIIVRTYSYILVKDKPQAF